MTKAEIAIPKNVGVIATPRLCAFCYPKTDVQPHFQKYGRDRIDQLHLLETDHVYVKPDILPSSPDHMLIIPKPHSTSFIALPYLADEVGQAIYQTQQVLGKPVVFFEHGSVKAGGKIQSIYYQHGHLISDGSLNMIDYMRDWLDKHNIRHQVVDTPDLSPTKNLRKLDGALKTNYLYIQQGGIGLIAYDTDEDGNPTDDFPSQLTQRGVSRLTRQQELNWKKIPESDELAKLSVAAVARIVDECDFPKPTQASSIGLTL